MPNHFILRNLSIFLIFTLFSIALQESSNFIKDEESTFESDEPLFVRTKRAVGKPGFIRTLFSVIYEQYTDTKNTIGSVNKMLNDNFLPENPPVTLWTTTVSSDPNATTTEAPYRITRTEFNRIVRRNLRGLVRLFNIELQDALKQSDKNYAEFKRNASIEVSKFL